MYTEQSKTRRQVIGVKALNNMEYGQLNPEVGLGGDVIF